MGAYHDDNILIVAKTDELLEVLRANLKKHKKEYEEAVEGWNETIEDRRKYLAKLIAKPLKNKVRKEEKEALTAYQEVLNNKPRSHAADYEIIIDMLEFHSEDTFRIERDQFLKYKQDDWGWKTRHNQTMALYTTSWAP
jgi:hypothetical protein